MEKSNPLSANSTPRILLAFLRAVGARPINLAAMLVIGLLLQRFGPSPASATTVMVTVGNGGLFFFPSSVTIHPGDTVQWTFSSSGHSSTSGSPGAPTGLWDSTILNQGATFSHTFNSVGSFPYFCTRMALVAI